NKLILKAVANKQEGLSLNCDVNGMQFSIMFQLICEEFATNFRPYLLQVFRIHFLKNQPNVYNFVETLFSVGQLVPK
ncbi:hypothetical protein, partial [Tateyamaria sp.]|uniref:hypothetical protein n=1 Tax=Tateyamaria sp. TaxID=1929288 RepID=UPI00329DD2EB